MTSGGLLIDGLKLDTFFAELLPPNVGAVGVPAWPDSDELIESLFWVSNLLPGDIFDLSYNGVNILTFSELSFLRVGSYLTAIDRFSLYSIDIAALFYKVPPGKSFN